jgi:RNase P/RNase MRP subunit POP5
MESCHVHVERIRLDGGRRGVVRTQRGDEGAYLVRRALLQADAFREQAVQVVHLLRGR